MIDDGLGGFAFLDEIPVPERPLARRVASPGSRPGHVRKAYASRGDDATLSRFVKTRKAKYPTQAALLDSPRVESPSLWRRPYVQEGRSKSWRKGVKQPGEAPRVLVSGFSNAKIGRDVRKGPLRGYWIYTLTLEERATCPRTCRHWISCYGNNMPFAARFDHRDPDALQAAIERDVAALLGVRGRRGVLVRLHALGDFFSPSYVDFWSRLLDRNPRLSVFGYTAREPKSVIGRRITRAKVRHGSRFAIRWSNGGRDSDCTVSVRAVDEPVNAVVCPEQTGATRACATCGFCWGSTRNVAFIEH